MGGAIQYAGAKNDTLDDKLETVDKYIGLTQNYLNEQFEKEGEGRPEWAKTFARGSRSASSSLLNAGVGVATGTGMLPMALSVEGNAINEKLNEGATLQEAIDKADVEATIEVLSEKLLGGVEFGGSVLGKLGDKLLTNKDYEGAIGEIVWLIVTLANQPILIHNYKNKGLRL